MNLILDIGNTRAKAGIFDQDKLVEVHSSELSSIQELVDSLDINEDWSIAISSVSIHGKDLELPDTHRSRLELDHQTPIPLTLDYETPETLGLDRVCGSVAAHMMFPKENVLVIDIGTCITYDLIESNGIYRGGGISPGYEMRIKAMNHFTQRLPLVKSSNKFPNLGKSTEESILFGAARGMVAEINGIIKTFHSDYQQLRVITTGGDSSSFDQHIENPIFAAPNLVLKGLNNILLHNQELNA